MTATGHCYLVVFAPTSSGYRAHCPDLPGCSAEGASFDSARTAITQAMIQWVREMKLRQEPIPPSVTIDTHLTPAPVGKEGKQAIGIMFIVD